MCGIVGFVKLDPRETVDEARLKQMRDALLSLDIATQSDGAGH